MGLALSLFSAACGQDGGTSSQGAGASGTGASGGSGAGEPGKPFTILDWNTHNFFDTSDDPNIPAAEETVFSQADYAKKRQTIGATLKSSNADVIVLAEIENKGILDDLDKQELAGAYPEKVLIDGNDPRGIDTAVLSKVVIDKSVSHKDEFFQHPKTMQSYKFSRDCLEVHLTFNGRHVILLGVHFRSKGPPDDLDKRTAEAFHTREIANALFEEDPTAAIVILGDYNDLPGSEPFKAIEGSDPDKYVDSANDVPAADRYTYEYMNALELIDHQMANPTLAGMLVPGSVVIKHGKDIDDKSEFASDHAPLMATYAIK